MGSRWSLKSNERGYKKTGVFWQISCFISKTIQDTAITMEDEQEVRSIEWCLFNNLKRPDLANFSLFIKRSSGRNLPTPNILFYWRINVELYDVSVKCRASSVAMGSLYYRLWRAKPAFIHNTDISNLNCWYQQFKLLISTIWIRDINNYNCKWITDISNCNCSYQQFKLYWYH